jgi:hypothetical protein
LAKSKGRSRTGKRKPKRSGKVKGRTSKAARLTRAIVIDAFNISAHVLLIITILIPQLQQVTNEPSKNIDVIKSSEATSHESDIKTQNNTHHENKEGHQIVNESDSGANYKSFNDIKYRAVHTTFFDTHEIKSENKVNTLFFSIYPLIIDTFFSSFLYFYF